MTDERSTTDIDKRLGQRLRNRRLEIGMSQERLAELLGVTFQQVQKYEKGVNRMAASRLFHASAAVDMPIAQFFHGLQPGQREPSPGESAGTTLDQFASLSGSIALARCFIEASAKTRAAISALAHELNKQDGRRA